MKITNVSPASLPCSGKIQTKGFSVYHRTKPEYLDAVLSQDFVSGDGDLYGKGMYSTFCKESQFAPGGVNMDAYGSVVVEFAAAPLNVLILDRWVHKALYKDSDSQPKSFKSLGLGLESWTLKAQLIKILAGGHFKKFDMPPRDIEDLLDSHQMIMSKVGQKKVYTGVFAQPLTASSWFQKNSVRGRSGTGVVQNKINGIIFTGTQDGHVYVAYNTGVIVPISYQVRSSKLPSGGVWNKVDHSAKGLKVRRIYILKNQLMPYVISAAGAQDKEIQAKAQVSWSRLTKGEKVRYFTLDALLSLDKDLAKSMNTKKAIRRVRLYLLLGALNPNSIYMNEKLIFYLIDLAAQYNNLKILDTFVFSGGFPMVNSRGGKGTLEYVVEELAQDGSYMPIIEWLFKQRRYFDPYIKGTDGHLVLNKAIGRDLPAVAAGMLTHPNYKEDRKLLPKSPEDDSPYPTMRAYLIRVHELKDSERAIGELSVYHQYLKDGNTIEDFKDFKILPPAIVSILKPSKKDDVNYGASKSKSDFADKIKDRFQPQVKAGDVDEIIKGVKKKNSFKNLMKALQR